MRIELRDVRKTYGPSVALAGVTLDVPAGTRLALVGPNGSGKSTLLRALLGLVACEGTVRLDGRSPFDARDQVARRLAYVPQVAPQLGASVREVVRAVRDLRGLAIAEVARLCGELGLELSAVEEKPFRGLSGGMKQKLLLALALAAKPELWVLDEPTASLDAAARERLFGLLRDETPGATLLLCSHRLEEVRALVTRVASLADGRLQWEGPVEEHLAARGVSLLPLRPVPSPDPDGFDQPVLLRATPAGGHHA